MYEQTVRLNDNEKVLRVNSNTGEIIGDVKKRLNHIPDNKALHKFDSFAKVNDKAIEFLESVLSNEELGIVMKMISRADYDTNVMLPLNDESSYRDLANEFKLNKNKITTIFGKLFDLGVYAQVRVANGVYKNYWTLNPYISWKGRLIEKSIAIYFKNTIIAKQVS